MIDKTAKTRVKRHRQLRKENGWQEVKVWVPTVKDAQDVKTLAAKRREQFIGK